MNTEGTRPDPSAGPPVLELTWVGELTWRQMANLREALFDRLETPGMRELRLDVRNVTKVDRTGVAVLIGATHRAQASGRRLTVIDADGPVTSALLRMHRLNHVHLDRLTRSPSTDQR